MKYELDDKFSLTSDRYNWILTELIRPKTGKSYSKYSYYGNLRQLSNSLVDTKAKDTLAKLSAESYENTPTIKRINSLMNNIVQDLELFLKGLTSNEKK
jgi:hypothetical protein